MLEQLREEFTGEDPARPIVRDDIKTTKGILEGLRDQLDVLLGQIELLEPSDEERAEMRAYYERALAVESR